MDKIPARARPPPYPRPVPDIPIDEVPLRPDDVSFYGRVGQSKSGRNAVDAIDADQMSERRASKRRRIEACAKSYLRGEQLFIMSATLKGPFDSGWQNPWAVKSRPNDGIKTHEAGISEIPETAKKGERPLSSPAAMRDAVVAAKERWEMGRGIRLNQKVSVAPEGPEKAEEHAGGSVKPVTPPDVEKQDNRVEDWLKKNNTILSTDFTKGPPSSPTPGVRPKRVSPLDPRELHGLVTRPSVLQGEVDDDKVDMSVAVQTVQQLSREMSRVLEKPPEQLLRPPRQTKIAHQKADARPSRAEHAILKGQRPALHIVPPADLLLPVEADIMQESGMAGSKATVKVHASHPDLSTPFDVKPGEHRELLKDDDQVEENANSSLYTIRPPTSLPSEASNLDAQQHLSSHAVSAISTAGPMPSAQKPPEFSYSTSSGLRDSIMLEPSGATPTRGNIASTSRSGRSDLKEPEMCSSVQNNMNQYINGEKNATRSDEQMTISMGGEEVNSTDFMSKRTSGETPAATLKFKPAKKRKQASFAQDIHSSNSLQWSMKAKINKNFGSPPSYPIEKALGHNGGDSNKNSNKNDDDDENVSPSQKVELTFSSQRSSGSKAPPKSILKSTSDNSRQPQERHNTTSTGQGQVTSVLIGSGQNGELGGDEFDLDAAISDLGSFLGTWDAEKEASTLL